MTVVKPRIALTLARPSAFHGASHQRYRDALESVGAELIVLHPGDPVEMVTLQRIELGQAALAVGAVNDPAWSSLLPAFDGTRPAPAPAPYMKRLPAVAAFAVLSLMSVAILAAVVPRRDSAPQPRDSLAQLIPEFGIVGRPDRAHSVTLASGVCHARCCPLSTTSVAPVTLRADAR
jgi:hypothetical protein